MMLHTVRFLCSVAAAFVRELRKAAVMAASARSPVASQGEEEASSAKEDAVSAAIRGAYLKTDSELLTLQGASGGACIATALVKGGDLYVAHLGDCRAVLSRDGAAAALMADHTCAREDERARVEREGGYVSCSGSGVWGSYSV
ncbi:probable protein phosphatase 2C 74 [Phragmites australis]|uniref:probable protein phosphatase 2C 74 n=1 Tax=Phragmites australis TaxID=29695 RepID=UPI002D773D66|nr:probable protein phosphatase 2C 74 [Phragmites australis]